MTALSDVTVGIKAFVRIRELELALTSLENRGLAEVIVADDSKMTDDRYRLYERFAERLPLKVLELPFRSGLAYGRNRLVEACSTPFFQLMDDDHSMESDIGPMLELLKRRPDLGAVAAMGARNEKAYSGAVNLFRRNACIVCDVGYGPGRRLQQEAGIPRHFCYDMVSNYALFRVDVFKDVTWDERFLIGREHIDFYLRHQQLGRWRFALMPDVHFHHLTPADDPASRAYLDLRFDQKTFTRMKHYFNEKWGVSKGVVWGLSHKPKGIAPRARLVHAAVGMDHLFSRSAF